MPIDAAGSGGNGSGRLRTISSSVRSFETPVEQVEHDVAGEARRPDAEPREAGGVGDAALAGGAEEGHELRRGVDRPRPLVGEAQALELRERREEVARELAAHVSGRFS